MTNVFTPAITNTVAPCPICGDAQFEPIAEASDYEYELPGVFYISKCRNCKLILQNPRPAFPEILRYYTEKYEPYHDVGSSWVRSIRRMFLIRPRANLYRRLIGSKGSVVDIGCSVGGLLHELSALGDWRLTGVEPVTEIATMGIAQGLHIIPTTLEEAKIPSQSVDLAIMNHVLEHLPDPVRTTTSVFDILKPGGYFAGEVPSPRCVERHLFGRYWGGYHLPRHLSFFSPSQIKRFLNNMGFINISVTLQQQPSSSLLSYCNYLRARKASSQHLALFNPHSMAWLVFLTPITTLLKCFGSAPIIHFHAQKPQSSKH